MEKCKFIGTNFECVPNTNSNNTTLAKSSSIIFSLPTCRHRKWKIAIGPETQRWAVHFWAQNEQNQMFGMLVEFDGFDGTDRWSGDDLDVSRKKMSEFR